MITLTLTLTVEQLNTVETALNNYAYDLYHNYERNAFTDDEERLVQEALAAIRREEEAP